MDKGHIYAVVATSALLLAACASTSGQPATQIKLQDGGVISVDKYGGMNHVDKSGKPVQMEDGIEMTAADGRVFMMKNQKLFVRYIHEDSK